MAGEQLRGLECRVCGQVYGFQPADLYTCGPCRQALASAYAELHAAAETRSYALLERMADGLERVAMSLECHESIAGRSMCALEAIARAAERSSRPLFVVDLETGTVEVARTGRRYERGVRFYVPGEDGDGL